MDSNGNLIAPSIKSDKLLLSINSSVDVLSSLKNLDQNLISLQTKQATSSAQVAGIQSDIASQSAALAQLNSDLIGVKDNIASLSSILNSQNSTINSPSSTVKDLNLTPPDTLLATGSAQLANLKVTSDATISGMLASYNLNVSNSLKSLGLTTLTKTNVAGDLTVDGTLSLENGSELNVIGTLFLQKSLLSESINILNGKVTIDKSGNITTLGDVKAASIEVNKLIINNSPSATIGTTKIPAGQTSIVINTTQATPTSKILLTPKAKIGTQAFLFIESITAGKDFTVSLAYPLPEDLTFDWWMVEVR